MVTIGVEPSVGQERDQNGLQLLSYNCKREIGEWIQSIQGRPRFSRIT